LAIRSLPSELLGRQLRPLDGLLLGDSRLGDSRRLGWLRGRFLVALYACDLALDFFDPWRGPVAPGSHL
jgi:hypothetical protein